MVGADGARSVASRVIAPEITRDSAFAGMNIFYGTIHGDVEFDHPAMRFPGKSSACVAVSCDATFSSPVGALASFASPFFAAPHWKVEEV